MKELAGTASLIASIAIIVVLMLLAPKGFDLSDTSPIAAAEASN